MTYEWRDKVVLITGAANGIGACVVRLVLEEGAKHIAILDVDETYGVVLQNDMNSKHGPGKARFYKCDVTNDDQLFGAFQSLVEDQGNIDVVINNAGIMNDAPSIYKKEIEINVTALVTSTLKALELMRTDEGGKGGTVINISSIAGLMQSPLTPIYFGTKAAVIQFSNCIGFFVPINTDTMKRLPNGFKAATDIAIKEEYYAKTGVRIVTVCFGATDTALVSSSKLGSLDKNVSPEFLAGVMETKVHIQKPESAAAGLVAAYKLGASGSTWLATRDLPARDITDNVTRAYQILGEHN